MPDTHNKITVPSGLKAADENGMATHDLHTLLSDIVRKLNAADALDSATATTTTIVQALQK